MHESIRTLLAMLLVVGAGAAAAQAEPDPSSGSGPDIEAAGDLPSEEDIAEHKTWDDAPELQRTAGGNLIVNAFIMEGPVRVEILHRETGGVLFEREEPTLFPFEVSKTALGAAPEDVVARIYVQGELAHELSLASE